MKYICILWSYVCGLCYIVWMRFLKKKTLPAFENKCHPHLVVTLTSYGHRVARTLPYTLESILVQTMRPDRIILWLDNVNFSAERLPKRLAAMRDKYGVEIRFCDDIRSYKKLIPTLQLCPHDILVTIDDDLVYRRRLLEKLYEAHLETPNMVLCALAHQPKMRGGALLPYRQWRQNLTMHPGEFIFPLGGSGTLYPPHSLHSDVVDSTLFMRLAPQADDIWFWVMALKAGTKTRLIDWKYPLYQIDLLYQKLHKDASLMAANVHEDNNDKQIANIAAYYPYFYTLLGL